MPEYVKMRVEKSTRQALKDIGHKGETYDAVIRRLLRRPEE